MVVRSRLIRLLEEGNSRTLTVVSAPAGFGKTTLLIQWRQVLLGQGKLVGWLSLDPANNQESAFVTYLVASLNLAGCDVGAGSVEVFNSSADNRMSFVVTLANELLEFDAEIYLIIDEAQLIADQGVIEILDKLIFYAPDNFHIVLGTRAEVPISTSPLHLHDQLTEIRHDQLRFSFADAVSFLGQRLKQPLSMDLIRALYDKTEGWVAGLQVAAIALNRGENGGEYLKSFVGRPERFASEITAGIVANLSQRTQTFLMQTSILYRFNKELCAFVTGMADAGDIVRDLVKQQIFILPVESTSDYRYHSLFADCLQGMLRDKLGDTLGELHDKAAAWYLEHDCIEEAIDHLLAARRTDQAAQLIEQQALNMIMMGHCGQFLSWIERTSEQPILTSWSVQLARIFALAHMGKVQELQLALNHAKESFVAPEQRRMFIVMDAMTAFYEDDSCATRRKAEEWLKEWHRHAENIDVIEAVSGATALAYSRMHDGELEKAQEALAITARYPAQSLPRLYVMHQATITALIYLFQGNTARANRLLAPTLAEIEQVHHRRALLACQVACIQSATFYELDQLDKVIELLSGRMDVIGEACAADSAIIAHRSLARTLLIRGEVEGAWEVLAALRSHGERRNLPRAVVTAMAEQIRIKLLQCDVRAAKRLMESMFEIGRAFVDAETGTLGKLSLTIRITAVRVAIAVRSSKDTIVEAEAILERCKDMQCGDLAITVQLLISIACNKIDDFSAAERHLMQAIDEARKYGMRRTVLDEFPAILSDLQALLANPPDGLTAETRAYAQSLLLTANKASVPVAEHHSHEQDANFLKEFTSREIDILRNLVLGYSYKRISSILDISINTLKWHIKNIADKTGLCNRDGIADLARRHGIR